MSAINNNDRIVFDPADYDGGVYVKEKNLKKMKIGIRRGDTRHGDYSNVTLTKPKDENGPARSFVMSLAEARSLKAFLDKELEIRAR